MLKRMCFVIGLILAMCLTGCMTTTRLELPAWKAFRKEMLAKDGVVRLEARQGPSSLYVDCYYKDVSEDDLAYLKTDLKTFLSGVKFLAEYVAYARKEAEKDTASYGLMEHMPKILIELYPAGTDRRVWASEAKYYTEPYRSDRLMEIDYYQTWDDWDDLYFQAAAD